MTYTQTKSTSWHHHLTLALFLVALALLPTVVVFLVNSETSSASDTVVFPVKQAVIYQPPRFFPTGTTMDGYDITHYFSSIFASPDADAWKAAKDAGFTGPFLFYEVFDQTEGPPNLSSPSAQTKTCAQNGQGNYLPVGENSVTTFTGEFCQIHDSIVQGSTFDHDLDPTTLNITATENWFLHDQSGNRITFSAGSTIPKIYYAVNPANQGWRDYFIARLFRALAFEVGDDINSRGWKARIKANGIYLDNVGLGWYQFINNSNNHQNPAEFASSQAFADQVYEFAQQIYQRMHGSSNNYPVWANLIAGDDDGSQWDRYTTALDGGLLENFALSWGNGPYNTTRIQNQLTQAEKWINAGKKYIAIAQANVSSEITRTAEMKLSLATFLLLTDGVNGYYRLANSQDYSWYYDYPEYMYPLGTPQGVKTQVSSSPLVFRRNFACGYAEVNFTNLTGTIVYNGGCNVTPTPTPIRPTLSSTPQIVLKGQNITATFENVISPTTRDWIGLYQSGQDNNTYVDWMYAGSCTKTPTIAKANGSCQVPIPSTLANGTYQTRLFQDNSYTLLAGGNTFTVTDVLPTNTPTPTPTPTPVSATVSSTPVSVSPGQQIVVSWNNVANPTILDWLGFYLTSQQSNTSYLDWFYTSSCTRSEGSQAKASGSCVYTIPSSTATGIYNMRLFANNGYTHLATGNNITVSVSQPTPLPSATPIPSPSATPTTAPTTVPSSFSTADIGSVATAGSYTLSSGLYSVKGSGADIWGKKDEFFFVYKQLAGNMTLIAKVGSLQNTNAYAKAGLMIRESLSANSKNAFLGVTPTKGIKFQYRTTAGANTASVGASGAAPYWLKLARAGNQFSAYKSTNGTTWSKIKDQTFSMNTTVYVGLAVTSHNDGVLSTATFSNVSGL